MAKPPRPGLRLWDRLVLLLAWTATCGLVYLLGFYTGKGTQERQLNLEERVVRLPVTSPPPAEGQRPKAAAELTFYEKLRSGAPGENAEPAPKPAPPAAVAPVPPPPPVAKAAPVTATTVVAPPPKPGAPPPAKAAAEPPLAPPEPAAARPPASLPPATAPAPQGGGWTVEASPTRDRGEAEDLIYRLKARGYPVTLVRVVRDGDTWYRVHIGRYSSAEQANEMMRRLRDQEGVAHAFVATE